MIVSSFMDLSIDFVHTHALGTGAENDAQLHYWPPEVWLVSGSLITAKAERRTILQLYAMHLLQ